MKVNFCTPKMLVRKLSGIVKTRNMFNCFFEKIMKSFLQSLNLQVQFEKSDKVIQHLKLLVPKDADLLRVFREITSDFFPFI